MYLPFLEKIGKIESTPIPLALQGLSPEDQLREANSMIDKQQYHLAYQILKNIEEGADNKREVKQKAGFYKASLALNYMKDSDLAFAEFRSFLEKYPDSPFAGDAHFFLGGIYYEKRHDLIKAIKHLTSLIEQYPQNSNIQTAEFLVQDAAKQLANEEKDAIRPLLMGFLPNNWMSVMTSFLSLVAAISIPISLLLAPADRTQSGSTRYGAFRSEKVRRFKTLEKRLILIVILSQILSFTMSQYQSGQNYERSVTHLQKQGIQMQKK